MYTTVGVKEALDIDAAVAYIQKEDPKQKIGAIGFSLGASAILLSENKNIKVIVADSPYANLNNMMEVIYFIFPGPLKWPFVALTKLFSKLFLGVDIDDVSPAEASSRMSQPILLIHGEEDSQIPYKNAKEIVAKGKNITFWSIPGADHMSGINDSAYEERISAFFKQHLK